MVQEVLTHDERLRLECLAQAVAWTVLGVEDARRVVQIAQWFEIYLVDGTVDHVV